MNELDKKVLIQEVIGEGSEVRFELGGEKQYKINLTKDEPDERDFMMSSVPMKADLPAIVDHTDKMSAVKDQGRLGSCVGFATAAMKEWQEQVEHEKEVAEGKKDHRKVDEYDLSEAWVYWNCKKIDPWPNSEGTSIRCAMKVLHKIGVPCEKAYPYSDQYKGEPESWAKLIAKWGLIDSYTRCNNLDELRLALNDGPVVIGVGVFREWFYAGQTVTTYPGIIPYPVNPDELLGGHAICAVGYNDNHQTLKFKNSWGTEWGADGYGYLTYKYINNFMWDAWVAKDLSVTKKILQERAKDELI